MDCTGEGEGRGERGEGRGGGGRELTDESESERMLRTERCGWEGAGDRVGEGE